MKIQCRTPRSGSDRVALHSPECGDGEQHAESVRQQAQAVERAEPHAEAVIERRHEHGALGRGERIDVEAAQEVVRDGHESEP